MMIIMIVMMILMTDLYPGVMLQPGQELLLGADSLHPQLTPLGGHQHAVSVVMSKNLSNKLISNCLCL